MQKNFALEVGLGREELMINIELLHDFRVLNYGYFSLHQVGQLHNLYPRME